MQMSVLNEFMRMIEDRPEVQEIKKQLAYLEGQIKHSASEEEWNVFLKWEEQWAQYLVATSKAMFPLASHQGRLAHFLDAESLDGEVLPYKTIRATIPCEDECKVCEGVQISNSLALVRVPDEHHLLFCKIAALPDSQCFMVHNPSHALMQDEDHFLPLIVADMHNLTFAQFAQKYESFLTEALLDQ